MNLPTNGRQVWYCPLKEHPTDRIFEKTQPKAATICHVHSRELVNLAVLDQNGNVHSRTSVKLIPSDAQVTSAMYDVGGFATWPPRPEILQKALEVAERTEQAESGNG